MLVKPYFQLLMFSLLNSLASASITISAAEALIQEATLASAQRSTSIENKDNPWGPPHTGRQTSGDPRDDCPNVDKSLTALMPSTHWGTTTTQTPTLWFYTPYSAEQIDRGEFVLQDAEGFNVIEPVRFTLPGTAGFVSLTLPEINPPLAVETDYRWSFELYCDSENRTPIFVEGWIQIQGSNTSIAEMLDAEGLPPYQVYWENTVWFDAVNALAQQRLAQPTDTTLGADWLRLLEDGGLEAENLLTPPILGPVIQQN